MFRNGYFTSYLFTSIFMVTNLCVIAQIDTIAPVKIETPNDSLFYNDTSIADKFYSKAKGIDISRSLDEQLIPLDSIILIALENHPSLKFQEENILSSQAQVQFSKRQWTQNLAGNVNYSGGVQNQVTILPSEVSQSAVVGNGFRYGVGVTIPLFEFVARQKRVQLFEHQTESYRYRLEETKLELSRQVVYEYTRLVSVQRSLRIEAATRDQAQIQMAQAEKQFKNGDIPITEYVRLYEFSQKSELDFEFWRKEFFNAYYQFELFVGVKMDQLLKK